MRKIFLVAVLFIFLLGKAYGQGDGPRAYYPAPLGTDLISAIGLSIDGNETADAAIVLPNSLIEVETGVLQYTKVAVIDGKPAGLLGIIPYGQVEGTLSGSGSLTINGEGSGLGDAGIGLVVGLAGVPSLTPEQYIKYDPTYQFGVMARLIAPTGDYDSTQALNMGSNRWALQMAAQYTYFLGSSLLDPSMTTFEFLPILTVFSENDDPFGASSLEQNPLLRLEGHITRNLNPAMWVSFDGLLTLGGETEVDGIDQNNRQRSFALGATFSINLSQKFSIQASYGEVVSRNDSGSDGDLIRIKASYSF